PDSGTNTPSRHNERVSKITGKLRECDEYPFATTYEGSAEPDYDADAKKFNFSVKPIAKADNGAGGNLLLGFYAKNRIIDGMEDGFIVKIVS
ncbi:NucA/NucB deoxyribonuclease domain-containing protein, partial [Streptomyces capitiformicae]|uniref:NucA/NucB deoxyribonuclease domain-containing protein n=1 Tax=Streptomyces capitiformicae TaxID=2014920 RepID=UPI001E2C595B